MIRYKHYRSGNICGVRYDLERGDRIPMHSHEPELSHNVIVLSGMVEVLFATGLLVSMPLVVGSIYDFDNSKRHEIFASQGSASILNLFLNGMPAIYRDLPESELSGVIP